MSINVNIDTESVEASTEVVILCKNAELTIQNQGDYDSAAIVLKQIKARSKELDEQRKKITKPLDEAKKEVMSLYNEPLLRLANAELFIKSRMINYTAEVELKAREEQTRLQKLADAETAKQKKILDEKIARAEASGKLEKVEELKEQKENVIPIIAPVIAPRIEKPAGVSYRDKWSAAIVDEMLVPREYLIINTSALDKIAQATKGSVKIAGVEFKSGKIVSGRF